MPQPPTAHELWASAVQHAEKQFGTNYAGMAGFYRALLLAAMTDTEERDSELALLAVPKRPAGWGEISTTYCGIDLIVHFDLDGDDVHDWRIYASSVLDITHLFEEGDGVWRFLDKAIHKHLKKQDADSAADALERRQQDTQLMRVAA